MQWSELNLLIQFENWTWASDSKPYHTSLCFWGPNGQRFRSVCSHQSCPRLL